MVLPNARFRTARRWSALTQQRINKVGALQVPSGTTQVTGWASDTTYPAVLSGSSMVVQGAGAATIFAHLVVTGSSAGGTPRATWIIRVNGVEVVSKPMVRGEDSLTWSGQVNSGDEITMWTTLTTNTVRTDVGSYLEVVPN